MIRRYLMEHFKPGTVLKTNYGASFTITRYIAGGGQGDVYEVLFDGKKKALKWYKPNALSNPQAFRDILEKNAKRGSPDKAFLWPEAITETKEDSFGYIMDFRPDGYIELTDILITDGGGGYNTFKAVVESCIKIVSAFRNIHKIGYSYQDMNSGNFLIDPRTGDVLICDTDNVAPNGTFTGIMGTPGYMAPEVILGETTPNTHTDEFSLAVVLFLLLFANHPLEGEHWAVPCLTPVIEKKLYASDALFIMDPNDDSNRPIKGVHNNVLDRWSYVPDYVRDLFVEAFSQEAIHDPNKRVKELTWLKMLVRFQSDIVRCPSCGNEVFIQNVSDTICEKCKRTYTVPHTLKLKDYSVTAARNTRIYKCQLCVCNADEALTPAALVVAKANDPSVLAIKNMSNTTIVGITPSGNTNQVKPGEVIPLKAGIIIKIFDGTIDIQ